MAFNEKRLAVDTSAYQASSLASAIASQASPAWEIRNASSQWFAALLLRTLAIRNNAQPGDAKRTTTGPDFFARYPDLHGYLLKSLQEASEQLPGTRVPPRLFPIMALLARLRSGTAGDAPGGRGPQTFLPLLEACSECRHYHVRLVAGRALAPSIPYEQRWSYAAAALQTAADSVTGTHVGTTHVATTLTTNRIHGRLVVARCVVARVGEGTVDAKGWDYVVEAVGAVAAAGAKLFGHVAAVRFEWVRLVREVVKLRGGAVAKAAESEGRVEWGRVRDTCWEWVGGRKVVGGEADGHVEPFMELWLKVRQGGVPSC